MIDKAAILKYVNSLKPMSSDSCQNYQQANNISEWKLEYFKVVDNYRASDDILRYDAYNLLIKISSLNYKINYRYKNKYVTKKSMIECIKENYIYPFILIINDKFVKWENIYITNSFKSTYLVIDSLIPKTQIDSLKIYNIPFEIKYYSGPSSEVPSISENGDPLNVLISFDDNGKIITDYNSRKSCNTICVNNKNSRYIIDRQFFNIDQSPTSIFKNNTLYVLNHISNNYNIMSGNIIYISNNTIDMTKEISVLADNTIRIKSDNDISKVAGNGYILLFDTNNDNNINTITQFKNAQKNILFNNLTSDNPSNYSKLMTKKFLLDLDDDSSLLPVYARLLEYYPYLYNKIYTDDSILNRITTYNTYISKNNIINGIDHRDKYREMGTLIFNNGKLLSYNNMPNGNIIMKNDISNPNGNPIEFIRFNSIQNYVLSKILPNKASSNIDISDIFDLNNLKFNVYIDTDSDISTKYTYPIPIYLNMNDSISSQLNTDNKVNILISNNKLYNKNSIVYNPNQFRHISTDITKEIKDRGYILLPEEFNTCNDKNRYMVFYNGLMMDKNTDIVVALFDNNKPYYEQRIYPVHSMNIGDTVDIFYLPYDYDEYVYNGSLDISGNIEIDIDSLNCPIYKDLLLIFINGKLICNDNIENINKNTLRIINNESIKHLCVISFIKFEPDLLQYFKDTNSDIDKIYDDLKDKTINGVNGYNYFTNIPDVIITDAEDDLHDNTSESKYAWMSITRDFYNASTTNISHHQFSNTIDGSDEITNGIDSEGNNLIQAYNGTLENINYDIYEIGNRLVWVMTSNLNIIRTAIGIGNAINNSLAIHNKLNVPNRPTELFNGLSWGLKQSTTMTSSIIISGCGNPNNCISLLGIQTINIFNGETWSNHSMISIDRSAAVMIGGTENAIIVGGDKSIGASSGPLNSTELLNNNTWSSGELINIARSDHGGCGTHNSAMIIGGSNNSIEIYNGETWILNSSTMDTNRLNFGCNGIVNNSIMISGINTTGVINTVEVFDGNTCSTINTLPDPRYLLGSAGMGLSSIVFSGILSNGYTTTTTNILKRI